MKKIHLVKDKFTFVDDEDFEYLNQYSWLIKKVSNDSKVYRFADYPNGKGKMIFLHREIMKISDPSIQVIHLNGDYLDNQKSNLYALANSKAAMFRKNNLSPKTFDGVEYLRSAEKYIATISKNDIEYRLGLYTTPNEAAMAYDKAAIKLYGNDLMTNRKKGLIEYSQLLDIEISFLNFKRTTKKLTEEDKLAFAILTEKVNKLNKKYTSKVICELLQVTPSELRKISSGIRKISLLKIKEALSIIKEKKSLGEIDF